MKLKYVLLFFALATIALSSCKDNFMEWEDKDSIDAEDVPLSLSEQIAGYDFLKSYTDVKLGIGVGLSFYMASDTTYSGIVNNNFDDVTIGYNMKHGAMVGSDGTISFTKVDNMLAKLEENGMTLFGHCLVWHSNQNATYLNSLIAGNPSNYISNSDFEDGTLTDWSGWGNSSTRAVSSSGDGYNSDYCMTVTNPSVTNSYSCQQVYDFDTPLDSAESYTLTFMIKASTAASIQVELQNSTTYKADYYSGISVGTSWSQVSLTVTPSTASRNRLVFDLGATAATYYIDDVTLSKDGADVVELTDAEKATIVSGAMEDWISQMMEHYKGSVTAWDVLNEPIDGSTDSVRTDYEDDDATDVFPWMKYLGKDYGVLAFKYAREYGNGSSDKLFINDYGLESDLGKCQALIDYVTYIESQGQTVDGIGTQMHISIDNDTTLIKEAFELLAATGKLIRISELDVQVNTDSPGTTELQEQADMYKFVINAYLSIIPAAQQYEITIWGVSDNEEEHTDWIPDDAPNLWDADYARKNAYKGAADGLAGYDVSATFPGIVYTANE